MDIQDLLSPSESPATYYNYAPPAPLFSPPSHHSSPGRSSPQPSARKSSNLSQQLIRSPSTLEGSLPSLGPTNSTTAYENHSLTQNQNQNQIQQSAYPPPPTSTPYQQQQQQQQQSYASSLISTTAGSERMYNLQPSTARQASTPGMDTLADLASMQHQQHAVRQSAVGQQDQQQNVTYTLENLPRPIISSRSSNDMKMTEAATPIPRVYTSKALSVAECNKINELARQSSESPVNYSSHIQLITLLRKGLTDYAQSGADAHGYELWQDLCDARRTMNKIFPVGETLWVDWLNDEMRLARTHEDRIRVIELFTRAVTDEVSSSSLWRLYGDYMYHLWATTHDVHDDNPETWSTEEKNIGKGIFKWESMMAVWEQGVTNTQRRLNDSNIVWDRYMEMLIQEYSKFPSPQKLQHIKAKFTERLSTAHATWDETFQMFSSFISSYENATWENTMVSMNQDQRTIQAKSLYSIREPHELRVLTAFRTGDKAVEWTAYAEYLDWEIRMKGVSSFPLINGLFERATIRFPEFATLWTDYVEFLIENPARDSPVLAILERATRHCPWSGDLWSQRLLTMEAEGKDFREIEGTKHDATATGVLDVGGLDELMKVYIAWCGCLRRRAFEPGATEDELDIAEVAIRSALEHVKGVGIKRHGTEYVADPQYRLERIHIKFITQRGDVETARKSWIDLIPAQANNYDFWYRYYIWEMVIWGKFAMRATSDPETQLRTPDRSTAVLRESLTHVATMDWPEQLITMFLNHCEQHESVHTLRKALIEARRASKIVTQRREKAAEVNAAYQQMQQAQEAPGDSQINGKRKREEPSVDEVAPKKPKAEEVETVTARSARTSEPARDREHAALLVRHLPSDATELKVRQFFQKFRCGTINSINLVPEGEELTATVEFESQEDALFAQTKSVKPFEGHEITIEFASGTTLWVTNYPPEADREYIRHLFKDFGDIIDIRLPSLQGNTRRRFCYVQFLNPEQAQNATQLHGRKLSEKHKLSVKISDPSSKQKRESALDEGREVCVKNVLWQADEDDIKKFFSSRVPVESVRLLRSGGRSLGTAFVVFFDESAAEAAIRDFNNKEFKGRIVSCEKAIPRAKKSITTIVQDSTASPGADASSPSAVSVEMKETPVASSTIGSAPHRRTIALLNISHTVTPKRVENLFEQYGRLVQFSLRPDHSGAIAEYVDEASVGKASLGLEGLELEGNKLHVSTVHELKKMQPQFASSRLADRKKPVASTESAGDEARSNKAPSHQHTQRGGRRGGLGFKKRETSAISGEKSAGGKSNDYFKNLMAGSKEVSTEEAKNRSHGQDNAEVKTETGETPAGVNILDDIMDI